MLRALCEGTEEEGQEGLQQLRVLLQSAWEKEGRGREERGDGGGEGRRGERGGGEGRRGEREGGEGRGVEERGEGEGKGVEWRSDTLYAHAVEVQQNWTILSLRGWTGRWVDSQQQ